MARDEFRERHNFGILIRVDCIPIFSYFVPDTLRTFFGKQRYKDFLFVRAHEALSHFQLSKLPIFKKLFGKIIQELKLFTTELMKASDASVKFRVNQT